MTKADVFAALKANWYLVLALALTPVAAVVTQRHWNDSTAVVAETLVPAPAEGAPATLHGGPFKSAQTAKEEALKSIAKYKQVLTTELTDNEKAVNLRRIANLYYSPIADFQRAVDHYETLLNRFPFWEGNREIYPNLSQCYRLLGNTDMERSVYRRMLEHFAPETQEYQFAKAQLDQFGGR